MSVSPKAQPVEHLAGEDVMQSIGAALQRWERGALTDREARACIVLLLHTQTMRLKGSEGRTQGC